MFWDSSALVACLVLEEPTELVIPSYQSDTEKTLWWATELECISALESKRRSPKELGKAEYDLALARIGRLVDASDVVEPASAVLSLAKELITRYPLRAADSLQLAAASVAESIEFVCLDNRLREAARAEGFTVLPNLASSTAA